MTNRYRTARREQPAPHPRDWISRSASAGCAVILLLMAGACAYAILFK